MKAKVDQLTAELLDGPDQLGQKAQTCQKIARAQKGEKACSDQANGLGRTRFMPIEET